MPFWPYQYVCVFGINLISHPSIISQACTGSPQKATVEETPRGRRSSLQGLSCAEGLWAAGLKNERMQLPYCAPCAVLALASDAARSNRSTEVGEDNKTLPRPEIQEPGPEAPRSVAMATGQIYEKRGGMEYTPISLRIYRPLFGAISPTLLEGDTLPRSLAPSGWPFIGYAVEIQEDTWDQGHRGHGLRYAGSRAFVDAVREVVSW